MSRLPPNFYDRTCTAVAKALLGQVLVRVDEHGTRRSGRIVETEAYVGEHDLACHASKGRTARTDVMFGPPGHAYVYLIYGMHHCFNVVTEPESRASAVLVRGLEPLEGLAPQERTDGPGKLCRALGITRADNRLDLAGDTLFLEPGPAVSRGRLQRGPRIGVDYSGDWAKEPLRFWVKGSPGVSKR